MVILGFWYIPNIKFASCRVDFSASGGRLIGLDWNWGHLYVDISDFIVFIGWSLISWRILFRWGIHQATQEKLREHNEQDEAELGQ